MSTQTIDFSMLAAYVDYETERWRAWFESAPESTLDLAMGIGTDRTVRSLIQHIFAVELRYAQRLLGEPVSSYDDLPDRTVSDLWRIHADAVVLRDRYLQTATPDALDQVLVSDTRKLGRIESRAHTVVVHSLMHGIRHWAQIAAALRAHGFGELWEHDWLLCPAVQSRGERA